MKSLALALVRRNSLLSVGVRANVLMEKVEVKQGPFYTQFEVWFSLEADIASCHELDDSVICSGQRFPLKGGQSHAFPRCGMISNQLA